MSFQSVNEISSFGQPNTPQGSLCNTFYLENSNGAAEASHSVTTETEVTSSKPPKIWISKSYSMDDDLNSEISNDKWICFLEFHE